MKIKLHQQILGEAVGAVVDVSETEPTPVREVAA